MKSLPVKLKHAVTSLGCACLLAACGGGNSSSSNADSPEDATGTLSVAITDAPVHDVTQVVVEFDGVTVQPADGPPIDFTFDPMQIDLLQLTGENSAVLLDGVTVPAGPYEWIALHVNAEFDGIFDSFVEQDGGMVELRVPSGSQSGLRLVSGFTVTADQNTSFIIDWDLLQGLTEPVGQPGVFLRPALRITDMTEHGTIAGTVADALVMDETCANSLDDDAGNIVYVYEGSGVTPDDIDGTEPEPLTTGVVAVDGQAAGAYTYSVPFLSPGEYTVAFTCRGLNETPDADDSPADPDAPDQTTDVWFSEPQNATVADGEVAVVDFGME